MESRRDARRGLDDRQQYGDTKQDLARKTTRDAIVTELSARLSRVCRHLTDDAFAELVDDMADTKLRFAAIDAGAWGHRAGSDLSTAEPTQRPRAERER